MKYCVQGLYRKGGMGKITMAFLTVFRTTKLEGDLGYGVIEVSGKKCPVYRASPIYGDMGHGLVNVHGKKYPVQKMNKQDGDIGYGVVDIQYK